MATYTLPINSLFSESGDDVYCKPVDSDFSGVDWHAATVAGVEVATTNVYMVTLDETKAYIVYLNTTEQAFTVNTSTDVITAVAHGLFNGEVVKFKGANLPAGISQSTVYYVRERTADTFKIESEPSTTAVDITSAGSGVMVFLAPSLRSVNDIKIGTVPQVREILLTPEGEEAVATSVVTAIKSDPDLGLSGLVADAATAVEQLAEIPKIISADNLTVSAIAKINSSS